MLTDNEATRDLREFLKTIDRGSASARLDVLFRRHGVDRSEGIDALVDEIRLDGANTIASAFRGSQGVQYDEIVQDVARHLKIPVTDKAPVAAVEQRIIEHVIGKYLSNADDETRAKVERMLASDPKANHPRTIDDLSKALAAGSVGTAALANLLPQLIRSMPRFAAGFATAGAVTALWAALPLLNFALAGAALAAFAGPAFRKTAPTVVEIALLRLEYCQQ